MIHANPRAQDATRVPLRLSDLVREVDREPRIPDLILGERLGFAKAHNVRKLIDRNRDELQLHGALVEREAGFLRRGENLPSRGGRPGIMWFLNEPQALVICALARTPIAVKVRQDIIAVYMAHRRGSEWMPSSERERQALRFLIDNGHVIRTDKPLDVEEPDKDTTDQVFYSPVTDAVLATLAEFEAGDDREADLDAVEGDDEPDDEATALEAFGRGFTPSGGDDAEDDETEPEEDKAVDDDPCDGWH